MYRVLIAVAVVGLLLSACAVSGTQKPGETKAPVDTPFVTEAPVELTPAVREEKTVFVVFFSENSEDFSALMVKDARGEAILPVTSESTGEPLYGMFSLSAGEYSFTMKDAGELPFVIDDAYDQILVPVESPADVFQVNAQSGGVMVNPVYEGIVSEENIKPAELSMEDRAASLRSFYQVCRQDEKES